MKSFADYLPTMTTREREIVEAYTVAFCDWMEVSRANPGPGPVDVMRATPPAKEPESVERDIELADGDLYILVPEDKMPDAWKHGNRVRVTRLEDGR